MADSNTHAHFTKIFNLYHSRCILFAMSYTHDLPHAQDIVAEAMMVLWDKMTAGEEIQIPLAFLMSVIRNKILQYFRRELMKTRLHSAIKSDSQAELELRIASLTDCDPYNLFFADVESIMNRSLSEMSAQTCEIFRMSRFRRMSNREIAEEMGLSIKSVEYHITRALKKLRKDLGDYSPVLLYFTATLTSSFVIAQQSELPPSAYHDTLHAFHALCNTSPTEL